MKRYTINDYNRTRLNNQPLSASTYRKINEALSLLQEEKDKKGKKEDDEIEEDVLNELFGFGKSVSKPDATISLQNSDEENAEACIQWMKYFVAQANNNIDKALSGFFEKFGEIIKKAPKMIVKGIIMLLSGTIKAANWSIKEVANVVLASFFGLIRLMNSGIDSAKELLQKLYKALVNGCTQFYQALSNKTQQFVNNSKEKLTLWMGTLSACFAAMVNKVNGAAQAFGALIKKILEDAKKGAEAGVLIAKTWLQSKSKAILNWINETVGDIRASVVEQWNKMEKKTRQAYNNTVKAIEDWFTSLKDLAAAGAQKVKDSVEKGVEKSKEYVIDKKDKALVYAIQKAVKGLSANYSEDQIVALVRKCCNENMKPLFNGNYRVNEAYFYDERTRNRIRNRRLNS